MLASADKFTKEIHARFDSMRRRYDVAVCPIGCHALCNASQSCEFLFLFHGESICPLLCLAHQLLERGIDSWLTVDNRLHQLVAYRARPTKRRSGCADELSVVRQAAALRRIGRRRRRHHGDSSCVRVLDAWTGISDTSGTHSEKAKRLAVAIA